MQSNEQAAAAFRKGHFLETHEFLRRAHFSDADAVLQAEVHLCLGNHHDAERVAGRLSQTKRLPQALLARCLSVLADTRWYAGDLLSSLELYQKEIGRAHV